MNMRNNANLVLSILFCVLSAGCARRMPGDEALLLYIRSQNLYRDGRFTEAAGMLAGENRFVPALVLRGKAEYFSGDLAAAEKSMKRALSRQPYNSEALLYQARIFREGGNSISAQKLIEKLLGDNPSDIRALRFAAELAGERGASGEAASAALLDRAVEASSAAAAESALVFLDRARLRWIGGNGEGALDDLSRAKALLGRDNPLIRSLEKLESIISEVSL